MPNDSKIIIKVDPEIRELIPKFLMRMKEKSSALKSAIEKRDYTVIAGLGHRIKGSAEGYGFKRLTDMAARLEMAAENNCEQDAQNIIKEIIGFLDKVEVVYEN